MKNKFNQNLKIEETFTYETMEDGNVKVTQVQVMDLKLANLLGFEIPEKNKKVCSFYDSEKKEENDNLMVKIEASKGSKKLNLKVSFYRVFINKENKKKVRIVRIFQ